MEDLSASVQSNLDIVWIMVSAALVMFMQAGFTALESGCTRAKNTINVATKNITDFIVPPFHLDMAINAALCGCFIGCVK